MPLSRANRNDRRRRVMLDAIASDPDLAVETVRVKRQSRLRDSKENNEDYPTSHYRDPGYSQAVRKTCQQRMVQLIPVRRGTMSIVLTGMWVGWTILLLTHYFLFVYPPQPANDKTSTLAALRTLPIAHLFHLRSPYGIAHWITSQLWLITALTAWMVFQLRRHKLDDYRARYRIWVLLALVALFSSFDASTSFLRLLGQSIDGWTRREIGYGGWPLVLASFASIVGVLGIRLCSEIKSSPTSVASWLGGLLAWALAALLGTELIKTSWSPATLDLIVGACWVGGILLVFQAAGIYLRQIYIHAQKRFLERQGTNLKPIRLGIPKMDLARFRRSKAESQKSPGPADSKSKSKWRLPWPRSAEQSWTEDSNDPNDRQNRETKSKNSSSKFSTNTDSLHDSVHEQKNKRLFGFIPSRNELNEKLESEPIRQDEEVVVDRGLTKTRGWFGIGGNRDPNESNSAQQKRKEPDARSNSEPVETDPTEARKARRGFSSFLGRSRSVGTRSNTEESSKSSKRNWMPKFGSRRSATISETSTANNSTVKVAVSHSKVSNSSGEVTEQPTKRKNWSSLLSRKPKVVLDSAKEKPLLDEKQKRSFMSFFDGLRLKPPSEDAERYGGSNKPTAKPVAVHQGQALPSTKPADIDGDEDDSFAGRPMSKAERKKLRRMQQDDRRAA